MPDQPRAARPSGTSLRCAPEARRPARAPARASRDPTPRCASARRTVSPSCIKPARRGSPAGAGDARRTCGRSPPRPPDPGSPCPSPATNSPRWPAYGAARWRRRLAPLQGREPRGVRPRRFLGPRARQDRGGVERSPRRHPSAARWPAGYPAPRRVGHGQQRASPADPERRRCRRDRVGESYCRCVVFRIVSCLGGGGAWGGGWGGGGGGGGRVGGGGGWGGGG